MFGFVSSVRRRLGRRARRPRVCWRQEHPIRFLPYERFPDIWANWANLPQDRLFRHLAAARDLSGALGPLPLAGEIPINNCQSNSCFSSTALDRSTNLNFKFSASYLPLQAIL